jgi:hypothetical protein
MVDVASLLIISRSRIVVISTFTTYRIPRDAIRHTALERILLMIMNLLILYILCCCKENKLYYQTSGALTKLY